MLVALQAHYGDRLAVVGVSVDELPPDEVRDFADQFAVNYPIAMSTPELEAGFGGIDALPATFVIDADGRIAQRHLGLLDGPRTEHEVRALAGLPTEATVVRVKDVTGGADVDTDEIPGLDLDGLTPAERAEVLARLRTEPCECGCGMTIAQCRISDPSCDVSLPLAQRVVQQVIAAALN